MRRRNPPRTQFAAKKAPGGLRREGDVQGCEWSLDEAGKGLCSARHPCERGQGDWLRGEGRPRRGRWDRGPQPLRPRTPTSSSSWQKLVAWPFPFSMAAVWFLLPRGLQWPGHHLCALNEPFGQRSTCPEHLLVQGSLGGQAIRTPNGSRKAFPPESLGSVFGVCEFDNRCAGEKIKYIHVHVMCTEVHWVAGGGGEVCDPALSGGAERLQGSRWVPQGRPPAFRGTRGKYGSCDDNGVCLCWWIPGRGGRGGADVPREEIRGSLIFRSVCLYSGKKAPQRLLSAPVESHVFGLK